MTKSNRTSFVCGTMYKAKRIEACQKALKVSILAQWRDAVLRRDSIDTPPPVCLIRTTILIKLIAGRRA